MINTADPHGIIYTSCVVPLSIITEKYLQKCSRVPGWHHLDFSQVHLKYIETAKKLYGPYCKLLWPTAGLLADV